MNRVMKAAISNLQSNHFYQRAALFHSTPVLESKKRWQWKSNKKQKKRHERKEMLRNLNAYADSILRGWTDRFDDDPSSSRGPSWFTNQYNRGFRRDGPGNQGPGRRGRRPFEFCEEEQEDDDDGFETIFGSSFNGGRFFYFSFIDDEIPRAQRRNSSRFANNSRRSSYWNRRYRDEEEDYYDSSESEEAGASDSGMAANRLALGLRANGPITLEDVKTAYRACALKWHPDRHQGSSKAIAEEKFKLCSSAYQSLCEKLAVN